MSGYPPPYQQPYGSQQGQKDSLSGLADFGKRHGAEIAGAALSYKCGGGLGKMFAAHTAYNLAGDYKREQQQRPMERSRSPNPYAPPAAPRYSSHSNTAGDLLSSGKDLFGKAKNVVGKQLGSSFGGHSPLKPGNVVQLISRMTNRPLQIVTGSDGSLVLDANGQPEGFNSHFTVVKQDHKIVSLHNNYNYIGIQGGYAAVIPCHGGQIAHACVLRYHESDSNVVSFESIPESPYCLAFAPNGLPTYSGHYKDPTALFTMRLIYSASPGGM